jgi:hypothetical protein
MSDTKKLLRLGSDAPKCAKCGNDDRRVLCRIPQGRRSLILCANCRAERKELSAAAAARKLRQFAADGYPQPACVVCGLAVLRMLERDHLAGAANSDRMQPLCANHHALKSYMAEHGAAAVLRLRDANRSALLLQAAFEFGLGAMLAMFAAWDGVNGETARCIFLGTASVLLLAWAAWNVSADAHFEQLLGPGYDRAIPAPVPR